MKVLKKNQLTILVIALMLVTAGYLNYTANSKTIPTDSNLVTEKQLAAIGDATLVNSGEIIEENDKKSIANTINNSNIENQANNDNTQNTITNTIQTNSNSDDYFVSSKLEREKMYSQMLESYQKLLESNTVSSEQKAISQQEINKINQVKNAIMISENLIQTKGFSNSIIFVNDISISIIVKADKLEEKQIAQIQNIISREMNAEISNIHISNK